MTEKNNEFCTIIVGGRDKFSPTASCLKALIANTPEPHEMIVVLGGAPPMVKKDLANQFGSKAQFIFKSEFLNQPASSF